MSLITIITEIDAPIERVFDLARSVDLHVKSAGKTKEMVVAGVTHGLLEFGQEVTWRGKHFGLWQELAVRITQFSRPNHFRDSQVKGIFKALDHDHFFAQQGAVTIMKDVFAFTAPLGQLGKLAETLFLESYLHRFLIERNKVIKRTAENEDWKKFLPFNPQIDDPDSHALSR
jgi:ligand-binding SRPBCC domain-containing protein